MQTPTPFLINKAWLEHGWGDETQTTKINQLRQMLDILVEHRDEVTDKELITNIQLILADVSTLTLPQDVKLLDMEALDLAFISAGEMIMSKFITDAMMDSDTLAATFRKMQVFGNFITSKQRELNTVHPDMPVKAKDYLTTLIGTINKAIAYIGNSAQGQIPYNLKKTQTEITRMVKVFESTSAMYKKIVSSM